MILVWSFILCDFFFTITCFVCCSCYCSSLHSVIMCVNNNDTMRPKKKNRRLHNSKCMVIWRATLTKSLYQGTKWTGITKKWIQFLPEKVDPPQLSFLKNMAQGSTFFPVHILHVVFIPSYYEIKRSNFFLREEMEK